MKRIKKLFAGLLASAMALSLLPQGVVAATDDYSKSLSSDGKTIVVDYTQLTGTGTGGSDQHRNYYYGRFNNIVVNLPTSGTVDGANDIVVTILNQNDDNTPWESINVTLVGDPSIKYNINFSVRPYNYSYETINTPVNVTIKDVKTTGALTLAKLSENATINYDGAVEFDKQVQIKTGEGKTVTVAPKTESDTVSSFTAGYMGAAAFLLNYTNEADVSFVLKGNINVNTYVKSKKLTIQDATLTFLENEEDLILAREIISDNLTIDKSTISNASHVRSYRMAYDVTADSFVTVTDSKINFAAKESKSTSYNNVRLGNSETISISGSTITGDSYVDLSNTFANSAGIGGAFTNLTIENSTIDMKTNMGAAIGPDSSFYTSIKPSIWSDGTRATITIKGNSNVTAVSNYGAGIGLPAIGGGAYVSFRDPNVPIDIVIEGDATVTAVSRYGAGIGRQHDGISAAGLGGDINIGGGGSGFEPGDDGDVSLSNISTASLPALLSNAPRSDLTADSLTTSIATDNYLYRGGEVTLTINGTPTVKARSGVLAVYADSVTCNDTNLVQDTHVSGDSPDYDIDPATSSGAVTLGKTEIWELESDYTSVASTKVGTHTDATMAFDGVKRVDALTDSDKFTTTATGWQPFFTKTVPTFTVSFDGNGGSGEMFAVPVVSGEDYTLPECEFTAPDGKVFAGWATTAGGTEITTKTITVNESLTLFAVWKDKPAVTVTISPSEPVSVEQGKTQQFTAEVTGVDDAETATVIWSVEGNKSTGTTIDENGKLTVAPDEAAASLTVKATYETSSDSVTVTVTEHTHIWGEWKSDSNADSTHTHTHTCTICDATETEPCSAATWHYDDTHHWQICKDCGATINKEEHTIYPVTGTDKEQCPCGYERETGETTTAETTRRPTAIVIRPSVTTTTTEETTTATAPSGIDENTPGAGDEQSAIPTDSSTAEVTSAEESPSTGNGSVAFAAALAAAVAAVAVTASRRRK